MAWTIEYDPRALKDIQKLGRSVQAEIYTYIETRIALAENPRGFGKPPRYGHFGLWRYRMRDYRIICEIHDKRVVIVVVGVGHPEKKYMTDKPIPIISGVLTRNEMQD